MRRQKVHDDNIEKDNINGEEETDINIFFTQQQKPNINASMIQGVDHQKQHF